MAPREGLEPPHILSIQALIERNTAVHLTGNKVKQLTEEELKEYFPDINIFLAEKSNLLRSKLLNEQINEVEKDVYNKIKLTP